ncbi:MAG: hypothetical protein IJ550_02130 [Bacteroidaceae bacterium]|nr:hypothetical protein [Bacteroidaceae bacterium]
MKYTIYQVKDDAPNARYITFSGLDFVREMGIALTADLYNKVYSGEVEAAESVEATLENLFTKFNIGRKPEGFKGHSLSVSDVIELEGKFYYVDSYGFSEIELK